jgi:hypothetical protein
VARNDIVVVSQSQAELVLDLVESIVVGRYGRKSRYLDSWISVCMFYAAREKVRELQREGYTVHTVIVWSAESLNSSNIRSAKSSSDSVKERF